MRESDLSRTRELIDEFLSQEISGSNEGEPKKRQGRPPKRTGNRGRMERPRSGSLRSS